MNKMRKLIIEYSGEQYETDKILKLIATIARKGNCGHTFDIIIDPAKDPVTIEWDGDGCDRIWSISNIELLATNEIPDNGKTFKNLFEE